jgi:hypothetical protein
MSYKICSSNFLVLIGQKVSDCLGSWRGQLGNWLVLHIWRLDPIVCDVVFMAREECMQL